MVSNDGELIGTVLVNVDGITPGIDVGIEMGSLDVSFGGFNDDKPEVLLLEDSLGSTDGKLLGSDEVIKLGSTDGEVIGTILRNVYGITLGIDFGTNLVSLDGYFCGSNDGKIEFLLLVDSMGYTDGKLL